MGAFLGTPLLRLCVGIIALIRWDQPGSGWLLAGCVTYIVGSLIVTAVFNIPLNNSLDLITPLDLNGGCRLARVRWCRSAWSKGRGNWKPMVGISLDLDALESRPNDHIAGCFSELDGRV